MIGKEKYSLDISILGPVDSGKSTLIHHLDYLFSPVRNPDGSFKTYIEYISDPLYLQKDRRPEDPTNLHDCQIETSEAKFNLINNNGHRSLIKLLISNVFRSDAAIIVVGLDSLYYQCSALSDAMQDHIQIAFARGFSPLIFCLNKMDTKEVSYSEEKFKSLIKNLKQDARYIGYKEDQLIYVPISALQGDNLITKSEKLSWHQGGTLIEAINSLPKPKPNVALENAPLRASIYNFFNIKGIGIVALCKIISGKIKYYDYVCLASETSIPKVITIESYHNNILEAFPGMYVGLSLRGLDHPLKRGEVIGDSKNDPPRIAKKIFAKIKIINHREVKAGYQPLFYFHHAHVRCKIEKIIARIDKKTGEKQENPDCLKRRQEGLIEIVPMKALSVEKFERSTVLGTFLVTDQKRIIAFGQVQEFE